MNLIVAVDENWGIGKDNDLLFRIPEDMKYFREKTMGKVVVMGEATYRSMPGGKALPGRTNIVLSDDPAFLPQDAQVVRTMDQLLEAAAGYPADDVFVIGGASVYNQMMDKCAKAYVTKVHDKREADKDIYCIDGREGWRLVEQSEVHSHDGLEFVFTVYENENV